MVSNSEILASLARRAPRARTTQSVAPKRDKGLVKLLEEAYAHIRTLEEEVSSLKTSWGSSTVLAAESTPVKSKKAKSARVALFVDAENVSHNKTTALVSKAKSFGELTYATVYDRPNPKNQWKLWCDCAKSHGLDMKQVQGKQRKDLVDNAIQQDIYKMLADGANFDVLCLASGDGGYSDVLKKARSKGKCVIVLHTSNVAKKLKEVSNKVMKV